MSISTERVWMKYYPEESRNLATPRKTVYRYLREENSGDRLNNTALNYYGAKITYRQLFDRIEECAAAFAKLGVKQGEIVSFLAVAVPECITAIYAVNKLGATANTMDPRQDTETIRRMTKESGSRFFLIMDVAYEKFRPILDGIEQEKIIVIPTARSLPPLKKLIMNRKLKINIPYGSDLLGWEEFIALSGGKTVEDAPYVGAAAVVNTPTGGTTGLPKGVMLTNDNMNAAAFSFAHRGIDIRPSDSFLGIIPVFTSYGIVCGLHMPLSLGFTLIPIPKFVPMELGKLVRQFRPNHLISTPAFYEMMMNSKETRRLDLSFLLTMGSGGDTMNEGLENKLHEWMQEHNIKYPLAQGYGMSEASSAVTFCVNNVYKRGSVGIPMLGSVVSVFDPDTGKELDYGEVGEVCVTGPTIMKGYYNRQDETDYILRRHEDGQLWAHSGDLGYVDEDGFLFIIGRIKRMITRFDGHKVFPYTLENMVSEDPEVRNCCVVGVRDLEHGQGDQPIVFVELQNNENCGASCRRILGELLQRAEERGRPVSVLALEEIPLTGAGKNDYRLLEKRFHNYNYSRPIPERALSLE